MTVDEDIKTRHIMTQLNKSVGHRLLGTALVYADDDVNGFHPEEAASVYLLLSDDVSVLIGGCAFSTISIRPDMIINDADFDCMFDGRGNLFLTICLTDNELSPIACITAVGVVDKLAVTLSASPDVYRTTEVDNGNPIEPTCRYRNHTIWQK